jgi:segregation and condensation protein B
LIESNQPFDEVENLSDDDAPVDDQTGLAEEEIDPEKWDSDPASRMKRLEAVLFMSRKPLASRKISQLAHLEDGTQARTLIKDLNARYDGNGQAFHIKRVAGGYQMLTRPQFSEWIRRQEHVPRPVRLSASSLETLTVVAYRQPIIKAEVEAIRGVGCGEMLRQLLESGLIKIAGRSEKLGRPFLYATSKDFLTSFGLNTLQDLPRSKQLVGKGLPEWATGQDDPVIENNSENSSSDLSASTNEEMTKETEQ